MPSTILEGMRQQLETLARKVNALKNALILETQADEIFRLEELVVKHEREITGLKERILEEETRLREQGTEPEHSITLSPTPDEPQDFAAFKEQLQELLFDDLAKLLKALKDKLRSDSSHFNTLVIRYGEYQRLQKSIIQGTVTTAQANLSTAQIRNAITYIVNNLEEADIE